MTVTQFQPRRGTSGQCTAMTPAAGELIVDTTNSAVRVGDGSTAGGWLAAIIGAAASFTTLASTGLATLASLTVSGATIVSGTLKYGGVVLTNAVTGTGKMVLDTAPELSSLGVGEPAPSAGNLNIAGIYEVAGAQIASSNLGDFSSGSLTLTFPASGSPFTAQQTATLTWKKLFKMVFCDVTRVLAAANGSASATAAASGTPMSGLIPAGAMASFGVDATQAFWAPIGNVVNGSSNNGPVGYIGIDSTGAVQIVKTASWATSNLNGWSDLSFFFLMP